MPKQLEIEGTGRVVIPEIDEAAEHYVAVRDKRMALTEKEVAAKINLIDVVVANESKLSKNEEGDKVYRFGDELVILKKGRVNVKVRHAIDDTEEEDED